MRSDCPAVPVLHGMAADTHVVSLPAAQVILLTSRTAGMWGEWFTNDSGKFWDAGRRTGADR